MTISNSRFGHLRPWVRLVALAGVATIPAAWAAEAAAAGILGGEDVAEPGEVPALVACVAFAALWSVAACTVVLARHTPRPRRPVGAAGAVTGLTLVYTACALAWPMHAGYAAVYALAMPEVAFAVLTVSRGAEIAVRTAAGVAAVLPAGFVAAMVFVLPAAGFDAIGATHDIVAALLLAVAFAVGHFLVFVASGAAGAIVRR